MNQRVLVIGGGIAGASSIVGLRNVNKDVEIFLVEPKEYMEACWAAYRAPFEEWVAKGSLFDLAPFCEKYNVTQVRCLVKSLSQSSADLDNGDTIHFDVCVVATGATSNWEGLGRGPRRYSVNDRLKQLKEVGEKLLSVKSVLVIGGGITGTELAGDIACYAKRAAKEITVTLVHSGNHLCPEMNEQAGSKAKQQLEERGVTVILNERCIANDSGKTYTLASSGEGIEADEIILTVGNVALNDFFEDGLRSCLNENGWVEVDEYFRVAGAEGKIFSIGDCCTLLPNSGSQIVFNKDVIGHNINAALEAGKEGCPNPSEHGEEGNGNGRNPAHPRLEKYALGPEVYVATTGTKSGVMYFRNDWYNNAWTTWLLPWLKQKTMFFFSPKTKLGISSIE